VRRVRGAQRQPRLGLDLLQHDARANVRHARQLERGLVQEAFVALDVGHKYLDHVISLPGGGIAADDLRRVRHRLLEAAHVVLVVAREVHLGQHAQGQADFLPVHQRGVAADDAAGLHLLHALPARRAGEADRIGQLLHGLA
jgi:hypothetical protein